MMERLKYAFQRKVAAAKPQSKMMIKLREKMKAKISARATYNEALKALELKVDKIKDK